MRWLLILILLTIPALAHDPARPELNGWFDKLASKNGLCCSISDGQIVTDSDWRSKDGRYEVFLFNRWITVDSAAVIKEPNLDGRTIVWPYQQGIRCFMPGSMT